MAEKQIRKKSAEHQQQEKPGNNSIDVIHSFFNSEIYTHGSTAKIVWPGSEGCDQNEGN